MTSFVFLSFLACSRNAPMPAPLFTMEETRRLHKQLSAHFDPVVASIANHNPELGIRAEEMLDRVKRAKLLTLSLDPPKVNYEKCEAGNCLYVGFLTKDAMWQNAGAAWMNQSEPHFIALDATRVHDPEYTLAVLHEVLHAEQEARGKPMTRFTGQPNVDVPSETEAHNFGCLVLDAYTHGAYTDIIEDVGIHVMEGHKPTTVIHGVTFVAFPLALYRLLGSNGEVASNDTIGTIAFQATYDLNRALILNAPSTEEEKQQALNSLYANARIAIADKAAITLLENPTP